MALVCMMRVMRMFVRLRMMRVVVAAVMTMRPNGVMVPCWCSHVFFLLLARLSTNGVIVGTRQTDVFREAHEQVRHERATIRGPRGVFAE